MNKIFISYSAADQQVAHHIAELLQLSGHDVFFDSSALVTGERITDCLVRELEAANVVVVLLSRNAARSKWVESELAHALRMGDKKIIPVILDNQAFESPVWPLIADRRALQIRGYQLTWEDLEKMKELAN
jgi:hypothetical protein